VKFLFKGILLISAFYLSACQHDGVLISETPMSMVELKRIIISVIDEPRVTSTNGHELTSNYFDKKGKMIERPAEARERFYTIVNVLGDRRPYDIQVRVYVEVRTPEGYDTVGQDDAFAEVWADKIRKALHESREKRNFIDDFKAF